MAHENAALSLNGLRLQQEIRWLENIIAARLKNDQASIEELAASYPLPAV